MAMAEASRASPRACASQTLPLVVKDKYNLPDLFYLDLWPLSVPLCVTTHPSYSSQFLTQRSMPKHPGILFLACLHFTRCKLIRVKSHWGNSLSHNSRW
jgi:hypothetical protein